MKKPEDFWKEVVSKKSPEVDEYKKRKTLSVDEFWKAKSKSLFKPKDALNIGENIEDFSEAYLPLEILKTHLHVIGGTGGGKSSFLDLLIRDILSQKKHGLCLIDPHGFLYHHILNFLSYNPKFAEKVILFNPAEDEELIAGFNPLKRTSYFPDLTVQVKFITSAVAKVWEEDSKSTPLLRRMMGNILYPLIEGGYTFLESGYFVSLSKSEPRQKLLESTTKQRVKDEWEEFEKYSSTRKKDELSSLINRLPDFVDNTSIQNVLGRSKNVLDFKDIFENKKILLCNLSQRGRLSKDDAYLLGSLLINEMANYSLSRDEQEAKKKPFFLFIDEFQNFLTPDVGVILDQCRKFGLHLIMAHQHLGHLKNNPELYASVMTNARSKVIFGSLEWEDANILEKDVFAGEHNLKEIKQEIHKTTTMDYEDDYRSSYSKSSTETVQDGTTSISSKLEIVSQSDSRSKSETETESQVPVLRPILGKELSSREFYSLDEQRYKNIVKLKKQPTQQAVIKILEESPIITKIKTIQPLLKVEENKIRRLKETIYRKQNQYYLKKSDIKALSESRTKSIEKLSEVKIVEPTFRAKKKVRSKIND